MDIGFRLAIPGARTICYVENEVTAAAVLVKNMEARGLDDAPVWTDLRSFDGAAWRGSVDCIIGGYPCQPFSNAGKRLGAADPRHLWPAVERIVADVQPEWCFFENVGAHLRLGFREVARSLQYMGYHIAATLLTAEEVGAPHRRERLFILAQLADSERSSGSAEPRLEHQERPEVACRPGEWPPGPDDITGWEHVLSIRPDLAPAVEPPLRGVVDGVAVGSRDEWLSRGDQLRILGNGVVPMQAAYALRLLAEALT